MRIDFHTHCYPPQLAGRAMQAYPEPSDGVDFYPDGTIAGLKRGMERAGIDYSVLLPVARRPSSMRDANDYAARLQNEDAQIIAFGSVHPFAPDVHEELERIAQLGLKGVKLHTTFQGFAVADPRCKPVYQHIARLGLITLFHMGTATKAPDRRDTLCLPSDLARAIEWFDDAPVVAAHLGGYMATRSDRILLGQMPVYTDTAYTSMALGPEETLYTLSLVKPERVLFGSDTPWNPPEQERAFWDSLGLSAEFMEKIYYKNAKELLSRVGVVLP